MIMVVSFKESYGTGRQNERGAYGRRNTALPKTVIAQRLMGDRYTRGHIRVGLPARVCFYFRRVMWDWHQRHGVQKSSFSPFRSTQFVFIHSSTPAVLSRSSLTALEGLPVEHVDGGGDLRSRNKPRQKRRDTQERARPRFIIDFCVKYRHTHRAAHVAERVRQSPRTQTLAELQGKGVTRGAQPARRVFTAAANARGVRRSPEPTGATPK